MQIVVGALGTVVSNLEKGMQVYKIGGKTTPKIGIYPDLGHCCNWQEYWEES